MKFMGSRVFSDTNEMVMVLVAIVLLSTFFYFIQYLISQRNFIETCKQFKGGFKKPPTQVIIYQTGGFFFSFMQDSFFIISLIAKGNGFYTRDMNDDEIKFIKNLPSKNTQWIKAKVIFTVFSFISYPAAVIFYLMVIKN